MHRNTAPALLGTVGAISMASGVIFVHGPVARPMIYVGSVLLLGATLWNVLLRRALARCVRTEPAAATRSA